MIEHIFAKGSSFQAFPLKVLFCYTSNSDRFLQAGVTTSSRNFKKAVDRNRIKRVVREAYRLQKPFLHQQLSENGKSLAVFFIYTSKELPVSPIVYEKMGQLLQKLQTTINKEESG